MEELEGKFSNRKLLVRERYNIINCEIKDLKTPVYEDDTLIEHRLTLRYGELHYGSPPF